VLLIYLDNAATTRIAPEVLNTMMPYLLDEYGNPGGLYALGRRAKQAVDEAREQVAGFLNCSPEHVIFTSGATEGNNMILRSPKAGAWYSGVVTSAIEHDSVLRGDGFSASRLYPGQDGSIHEKEVERKVSHTPNCLLSIMYINNETGIVNDVREFAKIAHKHHALFHTDCTQAAGFYELDTQWLDCDFLTFSSHKSHGPKGVGALYVKDRGALYPMIRGGEDQEFGMRGGTENVAGIVGFGKACELAAKDLDANRVWCVERKNQFVCEVRGYASQLGIDGKFYWQITAGKNIPSKILNFWIAGVDAETLILFLDSQGICVSAGSACTSHENTPSHVLMAMGYTPEQARSSIRVSFSRYTTEEEVSEAAKAIVDSAHSLLKM
jgi:cysteine desulfurase